MAKTATVPGGEVLVDASLLVAILDNEPAALPFVAVLSRAIATSVNFGETLYKVEQLSGVGPRLIETALLGLGLRVEPVGIAVARHFNDLKSIDTASRKAQRAARVSAGKIKSLSLADIVCLAFAIEERLPVLTGDKHWCTLRPHGLAVEVFDYRDRATIL